MPILLTLCNYGKDEWNFLMCPMPRQRQNVISVLHGLLTTIGIHCFMFSINKKKWFHAGAFPGHKKANFYRSHRLKRHKMIACFRFNHRIINQQDVIKKSHSSSKHQLLRHASCFFMNTSEFLTLCGTMDLIAYFNFY